MVFSGENTGLHTYANHLNPSPAELRYALPLQKKVDLDQLASVHLVSEEAN